MCKQRMETHLLNKFDGYFMKTMSSCTTQWLVAHQQYVWTDEVTNILLGLIHEKYQSISLNLTLISTCQVVHCQRPLLSGLGRLVGRWHLSNACPPLNECVCVCEKG